MEATTNHDAAVATVTATTTAMRDMDELEGTLLIPMATQVIECDDRRSINSNISMASAAVPVTEVFDYDTAIAQEKQQQQRQQREEQEEVEATPIPDNSNQLNYAGVSDDSKTTVGKAEQTGKIRSEEELDYIRKANRKVNPHNYHEVNSVKTANQIAKQRDRQGLQVRNDHIRTAFTENALPESLRREEPKEEQQKKPKKTGYQVKEYDCGLYETNSYEVKEYKSVYD